MQKVLSRKCCILENFFMLYKLEISGTTTLLMFEDIIRNNFKQDDKIYSWWSYRNKDWKKSNRGRRLDHILISKNIQKYIQSVKIYKSIRDEKKPSDHVPISITLEVS